MTGPIIKGPGGWAAGKGGAILQSQITLSSAEMLALFTTPQLIVPAPGAENFLFVIASTYAIGGTVNYDLTGGGGAQGIGIWYGLPSVGDPADGLAQGVTTTFYKNSLWYSGSIDGRSEPEEDNPVNLRNTPLYFGCVSANPLSGDGQVIVTLSFSLMQPGIPI